MPETSGPAAARVVSAFPAECGDDAAALVFEYMAATQAETGRPVPGGIAGLPPVLQHECRNLRAAYRPPGVLLVAYAGQVPAGCVGLAHCLPARTAEVKRRALRRRITRPHDLHGTAHHWAVSAGLSRTSRAVLVSSSSATASRDFTNSENER